VAIVAKTEVFEKYTDLYENWFDRHEFAYRSELKAIKRQIPPGKRGIEIGVGSGRFAVPLGIRFGLEPSRKMVEIAQQKGITVVTGIAEALPFRDCEFDVALMVTVICFVDDLKSSLKEAFRILKPGACLLVGFVDRYSPIGEKYFKHRKDSIFYQSATFRSVAEVVSILRSIGYRQLTFCQTIFRALSEIHEIEPVKSGYGEGSFVVIKAIK
jgi:ubiquinone/menaquinone biosynthesis C-methylase UbiE